MKVVFTVSVSIAFLSFALASISRAQFSPTFLRNDSYWGDGKAEVDLYDAQVMVEGQLRHTEVQMILMATNFVPAPNPENSAPKPIPAIQISQVANIPLGLVQQQRSSLVLLSRDVGLLTAQVVFGGPDAIVAQQVRPGGGKTISIETSRTNGANQSTVIDQTGVPCILREELPLRIRTLDFSKHEGAFDVHLVETQKVTPEQQQPTRSTGNQNLTFKAGEREIVIEITKDQSVDRFVLDANFPFLLREWQMADGSHLKLKNSLRADYRQYLKNGDREKALKDPMLRHPD